MDESFFASSGIEVLNAHIAFVSARTVRGARTRHRTAADLSAAITSSARHILPSNAQLLSSAASDATHRANDRNRRADRYASAASDGTHQTLPPPPDARLFQPAADCTPVSPICADVVGWAAAAADRQTAMRCGRFCNALSSPTEMSFGFRHRQCPSSELGTSSAQHRVKNRER